MHYLLYKLFMAYLGSIHHHNLQNWTATFFPLWGQKAFIFIMTWAPSSVVYLCESDTSIINYIQTVGWHPVLAWSKRWVVAGSLTLLGCAENHIDYHSCFFWISLHHPLAIFSIIFHLGRQMMEMAPCVLRPWVCATAEIPSGALAWSPSLHDWLMEGGTSLSLAVPSILQHPRSLHPLGDPETTFTLAD